MCCSVVISIQILMIKKSNIKTEKYTVYRDFSKFDVHFDSEGITVTPPVAEVGASDLFG